MRRFLAIPVVVLISLGAACDDDTEPTTPTDPAPTATAGVAEADLAVTFVRVYPATPSLGQAFTVRAQVGNLGGATSDQYGIAGTVRNISTGAVYPVGAETMEPMQPGEDATVLQNEVNVADTGSYQFWVEITPWGDDADESNDAAAWSFTVGD